MKTLPPRPLPHNFGRPLQRNLEQPAAPRAPTFPLPPRLERRSGADGRETRNIAFELKSVNDDGTFEGYGSVFGVKDSYGDIIVAGAYAATLVAHEAAGTLPAMLWHHDTTAPIGVWLEMYEDSKGLYVKGRLALDTAKGAEAYAPMKMGALNGLSIGFVAKGWSYDRDMEVRTLTEVELWEVSVVTFPSNGKSRITGIKAADVAGIKTIRQAEQALRDAGFSADTAKAFLAEVKRIALDERDAHEATAALKAANRLLETITS